MIQRKLTSAVIALAVIGSAVWATAQTTVPPAGGTEKTYTIAQMASEAGKLMGAMRASVAKSFELLNESINAGNTEATVQRNDAITAMKGLLKLSEENHLTLQQRQAQNDRDGVEHEFVKISIAASKLEELYAQVLSAGGARLPADETRVQASFELKSSIPYTSRLVLSFTSSNWAFIPKEPTHASPSR